MPKADSGFPAGGKNNAQGDFLPPAFMPPTPQDGI
jgi:hypothetical protein